MSRTLRLALGAFLAGSGLLVFLAPFSLMLLPNPGIVRVSSPEAAGMGAYAGGASGWYRLFPYAEVQARFPGNAPLVRPDARIVVRTKTDESASEAVLTAYPSGPAVTVQRDTSVRRTIRLRPSAPLRPGRYRLQAPRGGLDGGTDVYYFAVGAAGGT